MGYCNLIEVKYDNVKELEAKLQNIKNRIAQLHSDLLGYAQKNASNNLFYTVNNSLLKYNNDIISNIHYLNSVCNLVTDTNKELREYYSALANMKNKVMNVDFWIGKLAKVPIWGFGVVFSTVSIIKTGISVVTNSEKKDIYGQIEGDLSTSKKMISYFKAILNSSIDDKDSKKKGTIICDDEDILKDKKKVTKPLSVASNIIGNVLTAKENYDEYGEVTARMVTETGVEITYDSLTGKIPLFDLVEIVGDGILVGVTHDKDATLKEVVCDFFSDDLPKMSETVDDWARNIAEGIYDFAKGESNLSNNVAEGIYNLGQNEINISNKYAEAIYNFGQTEQDISKKIAGGIYNFGKNESELAKDVSEKIVSSLKSAWINVENTMKGKEVVTLFQS